MCDELEVAGCTDETACNYDDTATDDDGSCLFVGDSCDDNNYSTTNDTWSNACVCEGTNLTGCSSSDFVEYSGHSYAVITMGISVGLLRTVAICLRFPLQVKVVIQAFTTMSTATKALM